MAFELSDEDKELFRKAVEGTQRVRQKRTVQSPASSQKRDVSSEFRRRSAESHAYLKDQEYFTTERPHHWGAEDKIGFHRPGVQPSTLKKIKKGNFPIDGSLDLHGLTLSQAMSAVYQFLEEALASGHRLLLVVHGKGLSGSERRSAIKNEVLHELQEHPQVLGLISAAERHGGAGAVYILLKIKN